MHGKRAGIVFRIITGVGSIGIEYTSVRIDWHQTIGSVFPHCGQMVMNEEVTTLLQFGHFWPDG
jgi:hypothetical protein